MAQTVSPAMTRKAEALAAQMPLFSRGRSKRTGESFVIVPGSTPGTAHWATSAGCTCIGFDKRGVCTHSLAVAIRELQAGPAPKKSYAELYPVCSVNGCDEDAGRSGRCLGHNRQLLAND